MKIFKLMAVAATFAIGFVACEKSEETDLAQQTPVYQPVTNRATTGNQLERIYNFSKMLKEVPNVNLKTGDVEWDLETNFAYYYSIGEVGQHSYNKEVSVNIPANKGLVAMKDVVAARKTLMGQISLFFNSIASDKKWLSVVDLTFVDLGLKSTITAYIVIEVPQALTWDNDDWYWGENRGQCDGDPNVGDAAQLMKPVIKAGLVHNYGTTFFFTDYSDYWPTNRLPYADIAKPSSLSDVNNTFLFGDKAVQGVDWFEPLGYEEVIQGGYLHTCLNDEERNYYCLQAIRGVQLDEQLIGKVPRNVNAHGGGWRHIVLDHPGSHNEVDIWISVKVHHAKSNDYRMPDDIQSDFVRL